MGRRCQVAALLGCSSAEEAEAHASILGLQSALKWTNDQVILESDCAGVITNLTSCKRNLSEWRDTCLEIEELQRGRRFI